MPSRPDPGRPGKKAKFESYIISKIRWAIINELRNQDWVPRRVRLRAQAVEKATAKLTQEFRRPPTETKIAEEAGMDVAEYQGFLDQYSRSQVASLEARLEGDGGPPVSSTGRASRGRRRPSVSGEHRRDPSPARRGDR